MRATITTLLQQTLQDLSITIDIPLVVEKSKNRLHGDYACNIALTLAKSLKQAPRAIAQKIIDNLPPSPLIAKIEIAGPGFINFFLSAEARFKIINDILAQKEQFGLNTANQQSICLEFISANPTGPLHVGHGRGAAFGATLANIMRAVGYQVHTEYYVNDAGRQMDILTVSVWLRYLDLADINIKFPQNGYQGDYIWDIAATLHRQEKERLVIAAEELFNDICADEEQGGDKEKHIDDLISKAKQYLSDDYEKILKLAIDTILANIRDDLAEFGIKFERWFSERELTTNNLVTQAISKLEQSGKIYPQNGAKWFRSSDYNDEKDRVVVRENGQITYFASDIAYHQNKFTRGFDQIINIWGADHHGYIDRVKAGIAASGDDPAKLTILLVQFANLFRKGLKVQMSTRSGSYVTLRELYEEVGIDAARFFYVMRKPEQHMDFDLDLAKSQSMDNPVYYIQYAHARVYSVMRKLNDQKLTWQAHEADLAQLTSEHESALLAILSEYTPTLQAAATNHAPHLVIYYLRDLASAFHTFYNADKVIVPDKALRNARLNLINAVRQIIANGLSLIGVSAPESM